MTTTTTAVLGELLTGGAPYRPSLPTDPCLILDVLNRVWHSHGSVPGQCWRRMGTNDRCGGVGLQYFIVAC